MNKKSCIVRDNNGKVVKKMEFNTNGKLALCNIPNTYTTTIYKYNKEGKVSYTITVNTAKSSTYEKWYKYDDNDNLLYIIDNNGDKITDTDNTIPAPLDTQYDDNGDIVYARYNDTESFYDYEYFEKE